MIQKYCSLRATTSVQFVSKNDPKTTFSQLCTLIPHSPLLPFMKNALQSQHVPPTLPTKLTIKSNLDEMDLSSDGLFLSYHGLAQTDSDVGIAVSTEPFSSIFPVMYYEVKIVSGGSSNGLFFHLFFMNFFLNNFFLQ